MQYENTLKARFLERPNRFIAYVDINGNREKVHVKNTGRCRELLIPGAEVVLQKASDSSRKTGYDLISVYKNNLGWVNIDSQAPNKVVHEWLKTGDFDLIKPEYTYGASRIDFYVEKGDERILMEVKGCTLEIGKTGYFPDAPTTRGVKHIYELIAAKKEGYRAVLAFVIAMEGVSRVLPNEVTDPDFALAIKNALDGGVEIINLTCRVEESTLVIDSKDCL